MQKVSVPPRGQIEKCSFIFKLLLIACFPSRERETHTNKAAMMGTEKSTRSVSKNITAAGKYFFEKIESNGK